MAPASKGSAPNGAELAPIECDPGEAALFAAWIRERGGIACWRSIYMSDPDQSYYTPARAKDGAPTPPPTWKVDSTPVRIVTREDEVLVVMRKGPIASVRIGIERKGGMGMALVLTPASSRKVKEACAKAGPGSWYEFDFSEGGQRVARIFLPGEKVPLKDFLCKTCGIKFAEAGHDGQCGACWTDKAIG